MPTREVTHREPARQLAWRLRALGPGAAVGLVAQHSPIRWVSRVIYSRPPRWKGLYLLQTASGEVPGLVGVAQEPGTHRRACVILWWDEEAGWRATANLGTLRGASRLRSPDLPDWALPPAREPRREPRPPQPRA